MKPKRRTTVNFSVSISLDVMKRLEKIVRGRRGERMSRSAYIDEVLRRHLVGRDKKEKSNASYDQLGINGTN